MAAHALDGITVLELAEGVSGPYCGRMLASYGAEVIKVEPPGRGDCSRQMGPFPGDVPHPEKSGLFLYLNAGKHSATLDITTASGRHILQELVRRADVLVESYPPGYLAGLGLSHAGLLELNPRLVVVAITGYGQSGPYRDYRAASITGYALGGHQYINGEPDREPLQGPGPQPEYQGGLHAFFGTMAALYDRPVTGRGQVVDVSIMECMAGLHQFTVIRYTYGGLVKRRSGNRYESTYPVTIYPCRDGHVALSASSPLQQELLYALVGKPELKDDPRFIDPLDRLDNADALDAELMPWFAERTRQEIFHTCSQWRIPCAPVTAPHELLDDPHFAARDFWVEVENPLAGRYRFPGPPFRMSAVPWRTGPAPLLGQHNEEVYCRRLGYSQDDLMRLRQAGVI